MIILDNIESLLQNLEITNDRPLLIGIDGRPCSGKSTLADRLIEELSAECLFLDDFFIPQNEWSDLISPTYPFPYFRNKEFITGVSTLAQGRVFEYQPFDWDNNKLGNIKKLNPKNIIIVEGVSVLDAEIAPYFYKKILVVSNPANEWEAICLREKGNTDIWKKLYLPSVNIYWNTNPWERADILYSGRGSYGQ